MQSLVFYFKGLVIWVVTAPFVFLLLTFELRKKSKYILAILLIVSDL